MSSMATIRLKYVTTDRSEGLTRYYLRLPSGGAKIRLPGTPGDPVFMEAYHTAIANRGLQRRPDGTLPKDKALGTMAWLVDEYYTSSHFKGLAEATQGARRNILKGMLVTAGEARVADIGKDEIMRARDRRADRPAAANSFLKSMSHLFEFAIAYNHARKNPTIGVTRVPAKDTTGHHTWTEEEINRFLAKYPLGTTAHLCLTIMLYTGLRVSDCAVLGRQHIRDGWLTITTKKKKVAVTLPVSPELQRAIDSTRISKKGHMHLLINEWDKPFSVKGLGQRMWKWCDDIGLNHCSSHGLRKAGATAAADNGATEHELMATFGWTSAKQAQLYTKKANRKRLAGSGAAKIRIGKGENANEIVPPETGLADGRDISAKKLKEISG